MKKPILVVCLLLWMGTEAQVIKPFSFGPLISFNQSTAKAKPAFSSVTAEDGFGFGGFARLKIAMLYAEVQALYSSHAFSASGSTSAGSYVSHFDISGFDGYGILGWRVFGIGPLGNFRLFTGYNFQNYSNPKVTTNGQTQNVTNMETSNGNLVLGTGFDLWRVVINYKYLVGIKDLNSLSGNELKTRMMVFELGFKF